MFERNKIVVGVVGTANTGKSTFIKDVVESAENSSRDKDMAWTVYGKDYRSEIERMGLKINRNGDEESQKAIHGILLGNIIDAAAEPFHKRIIMDRTIIDSFAYTLWHHLYGGDEKKISDETLERMWREVLTYSPLFNRIIYIPLSHCTEVKVVDDHFRDTNEEYRRQIDSIFSHILANIFTYSNTSITEVYGTSEQRVEKLFKLEHNDEKVFGDMPKILMERT